MNPKFIAIPEVGEKTMASLSHGWSRLAREVDIPDSRLYFLGNSQDSPQ